MALYKLIKSKSYSIVDGVIDSTATVVKHVKKDLEPESGVKGHQLHIPFVQDNADYQEYLEWVEAGNTAEAAD